MENKIFQIAKKYKTYIILILLCFLIFLLYIPAKKTVTDFLLTKKEIKNIKKQNEILIKENTNLIDSSKFYKNLFEEEKKKSDSSKVQTTIIKIKTNEEVKIIPTLPVDSNIKYFSRDLEEFIRTR